MTLALQMRDRHEEKALKAHSAARRTRINQERGTHGIHEPKTKHRREIKRIKKNTKGRPEMTVSSILDSARPERQGNLSGYHQEE